MLSGECKRKISVRDGEDKKSNGKSRKPLANRATHMNPGQDFHAANFNNISDEVMEQVANFMAWVDNEENHGLGLPPAQEVDDEENIRELTDVGDSARDLVRRIQRLRGQLRPGSAAAAALPDLRMDGEDLVVAAAGRATVDAPIVEGMD
jgi:hypothetical protein